jgi:hypothetical protein
MIAARGIKVIASPLDREILKGLFQERKNPALTIIGRILHSQNPFDIFKCA